MRFGWREGGRALRNSQKARVRSFDWGKLARPALQGLRTEEPGNGWRGKTKGQMLRKGAEAATQAQEVLMPGKEAWKG